MWLRLLIIFLLFSLLAILQTSFFVHFNIMSASLNLIFILFYLIVFFENSQKYIQGIFSAITAGFFLDAFSSYYFGVALVCLMTIVFVLKYISNSLDKKRGEHPIFYFIPLFVIFFTFYNLFLTVAIYFLNSPRIVPYFNWIFMVDVAYNLFFAIFGFFIFKKFKLYNK